MTILETGLPNSWSRGGLWDMAGRAQVITFIGAGGKTTCLRSITQEINSFGLRVIATTTTKVFPQEHINVWKNTYPPPYEQEDACFWYIEAEEESGKWLGPPLKAVDDAILEDLLAVEKQNLQAEERRKNSSTGVDTCKRFWAIEGDGARGRKLKCWAPHEPQIPVRSDCAVLVSDRGLWGKVLQADQVHRFAGCLDLLGQVWNAEKAWSYFLRSPVFAPQYGQMSWVILLNGYGVNVENKEVLDPILLLYDLNHRWAEIQQGTKDLEYRPRHLRLAAGDAKEGKIQWFDLW